MGVAYSGSALCPSAVLSCLPTHSSSPEVGNGLSWPKPQCTCNAMVTSHAQHSTNEGVLRSNSACSMLMSDDLWLPRRGIEPRPTGFREVDSTAMPLPFPAMPSTLCECERSMSALRRLKQGGQQSQRMKFPDFSRFSRPFLVKFQTNNYK